MLWLALALFLQTPQIGWQEHNRLGEEAFRAGDMAASIRHFDQAIQAEPRLGPHHWQRGISLYYAGRYQDCAKQFVIHRTVNPEDVENAVFHYLCVAGAGGVPAARSGLIPIRQDARIPMMEVYAMYQGKSTPEKVLSAAASGNPEGVEKQNRFFYAHLYIGLWLHAAGDSAGAREHIGKAANEYVAAHYMGDVARVHLKLAK
ncbi:MAG: hypothetical protein JJE04_24935 [Acidobacteriia bacterium]|nr:hypothetical protein [Terriglobia bacterium]